MDTATLEAARVRTLTKIADAASSALGFTPDQRAAYLVAVLAAPDAIRKGKRMYPYPLHDDGMKAARSAGYVGGDHPVLA